MNDCPRLRYGYATCSHLLLYRFLAPALTLIETRNLEELE
jgi:hypothetical protein